MSILPSHFYLYKEHFSEYTSYERLIARNLNGCPKREFKITIELQSSVTYIFIMGIYLSISEGSYSILVSAHNNITFNLITESNIQLTISSFNRDFH